MGAETGLLDELVAARFCFLKKIAEVKIKIDIFSLGAIKQLYYFAGCGGGAGWVY